MSSAETTREDRGLVERVEAVDVERRVRLGEPELLRVAQHVLERLARPLHLGEDVVAGAIEDAVDRLDPGADEAVAHRADDRDAAADGRAEEEVDALLRGEREELRAGLGEELLVGGHDGLARLERLLHELLRDAGAADELDDDVDRRVADRGAGVGAEDALRERHAAVGRRVEVGDAPQLDVEPGALAQNRAVLEQALGDACADGSESQDGDSDRFHASSPVSCVEGRGL